MKRIIVMCLSFLLLISLVGCSNSSDNSGASNNDTKTLTLALRSGTYSDVIKKCLPEFEKANNVKCEVLELAEDDLHSKLALDATNKKGAYDLCMVDGSWMAEFTANGVLANLSELGYKFDDDIIPATTKVCYYKDNIYLAPYYGNVTVLLYNKDLVKKAGYDATSIDSLDAMLAICKDAKANGKKGFIYRGDSENNIVVDFLPILLSYGGWVIDDNNKPTVNTKEFKEAMNYYLELIATGDAEVKDDLIATVDSGKGAMGVGWPGWYLPTTESTADYSAITGKVSSNSEAYNANVYGVWTIGLTANGANKELSMKLLDYLMNAEVQKSTVTSGGVPCRYSSLKDTEILKQYPQYEVVCKALEGGVYRPVIEQWTEFYTILGTEMGNIINGKKSVDDGLNDAQAKLETLMK